MRTIGYPQLRFLRARCDEGDIRPCYFLMTEVVVSTLSETVSRCDQETNFGFRHEQTLREGLVQIDDGEKLAEVGIVEKPEPTHPGLYTRHHGEPLRCVVHQFAKGVIRMVYVFDCMVEDHQIGAVFPAQRLQTGLKN